MLLTRPRAGEGGAPAEADGPSATADWVDLEADGSEVRRLHGLPGASPGGADAGEAEAAEGETGTVFVIGDPALDRFSDGSPAFGLTLTLERPPGLDDHSLVPLVTGGALSLQVTVNPTDAELAASSVADRPVRRIFPVRLQLRLGGEADGVVIAGSVIDGPAGAGALSANLSRDDALAVLRAAEGEADSPVAVAADVTFRALTRPLPPLIVTVDLALAHDRLARGAGPGKTIAEPDVQELLTALVREGWVRIEGLPETFAPPDPAELAASLREGLLRALMPILIRVPGLEGQSGHYRLGSRPADGSRFTFQQRRSEGEAERTVELRRPLGDVLRGLTADRPLDAFVRAVCVGQDGTLQPVANRVAGTRAGPAGEEPADMAALGGVTAAMPAVLRTSVAATSKANVLAASDIAIRRPGRLQAWAVNDLVLAPAAGGEQLQVLPIVEGSETLWPDRTDGNRYWYAPQLSVVEPEPTATPGTSPYAFSFRIVGHDSDGKPGLEATIRITLRPGMSAATTESWEAKGKPAAQPVPTNGLAVALQVPFRGEDGQTTRQQITAVEAAPSGTDIVATFNLTDRWARLAYGALSRPGFQSEPARVIVSYTFQAYVPADDGGGRIAWGGKIATVPNNRLTLAPPPGPDDPGPDWLTLEAATVAVGARDAADLDGETADVPTLRPINAAALHLAANHLVLQPASPAIHPILVAPIHVPPPKTYGIRTQGRTIEVEALLPCSTYGPLYLQTGDLSTGDTSPDQAIGCREVWTLGQTALRLYEPVSVDVGVADPGFTVHRSLQVPGRFLVVPRAYTITRYEPGDDRAYRPAVYLFSSVDAVHPDRSSCIVMATLRPAVTPANRQALLDALRAKVHPSPSLEWPTELTVTPTYQWAIATGGGASAQIVPAAARTPEGFQVSLATGIDGILQLRAILEAGGVAGSVSFPLADGQTLQASLVVDLGRIDGPWEAGAVEARLDRGSAVLTNRVERAADVLAVLPSAGGVPMGPVPVERRLAPGEKVTVAIGTGANAVLARYVLASGPTTIEEVRTFVEDIYTNVVFTMTLDLAAAGMTGLAIEARIVGVAGSRAVSLDAGSPSGEASFVLPLTVYLAHPTLQYRVTAQTAGGPSPPGDWHDWHLDTQGSVIEISSAT